MARLLVVESKIKEIAKIDEKSLQVGTDFTQELSKEVEKIVKKACNRAKANHRNTLKARDI